MQRKAIAVEPNSIKMLDPFMPRPDYCDRGYGMVFNGNICIDITVCEFYCDRDCSAYREYVLEGERQKSEMKKKRRKEMEPKRRDISF